MRWKVGASAEIDSKVKQTYQHAIICKTFPAYKLGDFARMPGREYRAILHALDLLNLAAQADS